MLDPAVGEGHRVGASNVRGTVGLFFSIEVGLGVVISNSIGVGVGRNLVRVLLGVASVDSVDGSRVRVVGFGLGID